MRTKYLLLYINLSLLALTSSAMQKPDDSTQELYKAIESGDIGTAVRSIVNGNHTQESLSQHLAIAVSCNQHVIAALLIKGGAKATDKQFCSEPLLHRAIDNCNPLLVRLLLNAGASITEQNTRGQTPLDCAYKKNRYFPSQETREILRLLSQ